MTNNDILNQVASGKLTPDQAAKMLADNQPKRALICKVSQKGAVSVYGLQRMPVTLYAKQWERLLGYGNEIKAFITANDMALARKGS